MRNGSIRLLMVLTTYLGLVSCASLQEAQCDFAGAPIADCTEEAETYIRDAARVLKAPACSKSTVTINKGKTREIRTQDGETTLGTATDEARVVACYRYRNLSARIS
jgi:hypothetical protein